MCGIAGLVGSLGGRQVMSRMLPEMHMRGPDGEGVWQDESVPVVLGHKRLSIIDIEGGAQPMHSPDGRYSLTYNGEVYNYRELRTDLEAGGWVFRTDCDTEVLLAGLVLEGKHFLQRINGMFAFALWDRDERTMLLARDRVGIKPLYIASPGDRKFAFASELKSLLHVPGVDAGLNSDALGHYLTQRFVSGPMTMVRGIGKFPPGHYGIYKNGRFDVHRYWDVTFNSLSAQHAHADDRQIREEFETLLADAVGLRLRSDVPFGAFLSAGVDSSLVVGLMARASSSPVRTYSIGFSGIDDEREDARNIAQALGTIHQDFELDRQDLMGLKDVVRAVDEPFPDPIVLAMSLLAKKASSDVKVILTGEGADELLGGYVHHPHLHLLSKVSPFVPKGLARAGGWMANRMPLALVNTLFNYPADLGEQGRNRLSGLLTNMTDDVQRYFSYVSLFASDEMRELVNHDFLAEMRAERSPQFMAGENLAGAAQGHAYIDRVWTHEYKTWLPDNILFKQDKTLMSHSIEGRVPFCDHRLIELVSQLPLRFRFHEGRNKALLRDVAHWVLEGVPVSKNKKAFMVPLEGGYGEVIREMAGDILTGTRFRNLGIFSPQAVERLLAYFPNPPFLVGKQLMALLMFGLWEEAVFGS